MPSSTGSDPRVELRLRPSRTLALVLLGLQLPALLGLWLISPFWLALVLAGLSAALAWRQWRRQRQVEALAFRAGQWWLRRDGQWMALSVSEHYLRPGWGCLLGRPARGARLRLLWFSDAVEAEAYRRLRVAVGASESSGEPRRGSAESRG